MYFSINLFFFLVYSSLAYLQSDLEFERHGVVHTAFVQTGAELLYFTEYSAEATESRSVESVEGTLSLSVSPSSIDFGSTPLGTAVSETVRICNGQPQPVLLESVTGSSLFTHASFPEKSFLKADECTRMRVAFLPRVEGRRRAPLRVTASPRHSVSIDVTGHCTWNPYRLPPMGGLPMALNATLRRRLLIHNPHPHTLRISDIATSGGGLFVSLPGDALHAHQNTWDVRPFQSRHVADLVLFASHEMNSTVFAVVDGHLDKDGEPMRIDPLFFPLPFEVVSAPNIYAYPDVLDFGHLSYGSHSDTLSFYAYSTFGWNTDFELLRLYVEPPSLARALNMQTTDPHIYSHRLYVPGPHTVIARLSVNTGLLPRRGRAWTVSGRVTAVGKKHNVTVPVTVSVYTGDVEVVGEDGNIHEGTTVPHRRAVRLRSTHSFPVIIYNVSLPHDALKYFTLRMFERVVHLEDEQFRPVFLLKYNKKAPPGFSTNVFVHTNVSTFSIPVNLFHGKLEFKILEATDQNVFDFGLIERNDSRSIHFEMRNENAASIAVHGLRLPFPQIAKLFIVGRSGQKQPREECDMGSDVVVPPHGSILFELLLRVPLDGSVLKGDLSFETDFERKELPIEYQVAKGRLIPIPGHLRFGKSHPGKISYRTLQLFNSFEEDMRVMRVSSLWPVGVRFEGSFSQPLVRSGRFCNLGRVVYMPPIGTPESYLGLPLSDNSPNGDLTDSQWFVHGMSLPTNLPDIDAYLYKRMREKFDRMVASGENVVNTTVVVHTDKAKHVHIAVSASMTWPRLLTRTSVHFPLTALGNFTIVNLTLSNPTSVPIVVQLIPLVIYPDPEAVVEVVRDDLLTPLTEHIEMNETLMFSLRDTELFALKPDSPVPRMREELEQAIGTSIPRFTLSMILKPHMKTRIRLGFLPSDYTLRSSLLIIRNNLTIIEPVVVYGRGARIGVEVEGEAARGRRPLLFEIRHDHLHDCDNPKRLTHRLTSTLTVRRPFTVKNVGEVNFTISNMSINNVACENRGFKILNCYPFRLAPNETYALDVAFTPDFLSSTNEADMQLYMFMNGSAWVFPLAATVPSDMLQRCHQALPRPPFEHLMYYLCVFALIFCLVCVLACAYLEGDRAIVCALRAHYANLSPVFDLNVPTPPRDGGVVELHVSHDASPLKKAFYHVANIVLFVVHHFWRLTLWIRPKEENREARTSRKRRRRTILPKKKEDPTIDRIQRIIDEPDGRGRAPSSPSQPSSASSPPPAAVPPPAPPPAVNPPVVQLPPQPQAPRVPSPLPTAIPPPQAPRVPSPLPTPLPPPPKPCPSPTASSTHRSPPSPVPSTTPSPAIAVKTPSPSPLLEIPSLTIPPPPPNSPRTSLCPTASNASEGSTNGEVKKKSKKKNRNNQKKGKKRIESEGEKETNQHKTNKKHLENNDDEQWTADHSDDANDSNPEWDDVPVGGGDVDEDMTALCEDTRHMWEEEGWKPLPIGSEKKKKDQQQRGMVAPAWSGQPGIDWPIPFDVELPIVDCSTSPSWGGIWPAAPSTPPPSLPPPPPSFSEPFDSSSLLLSDHFAPWGDVSSTSQDGWDILNKDRMNK